MGWNGGWFGGWEGGWFGANEPPADGQVATEPPTPLFRPKNRIYGMRPGIRFQPILEQVKMGMLPTLEIGGSIVSVRSGVPGSVKG